MYKCVDIVYDSEVVCVGLQTESEAPVVWASE